MNLQLITDAANAWTDENFNTSTTIYFANECLSKINLELKISLPLFENASTDYTALSNTWINSLLVPYVAYGIKRNDGSNVEAREFLNTFLLNLSVLQEQRTTAIDTIYRNENFGNIYILDPSSTINVGWWRKFYDDEDGDF